MRRSVIDGQARVRAFLIGFVAFSLCVLFAGSSFAAYPKLTTFVTDNANLIDDAPQSSLEAELVKLEKDTGAQFVVVTIPTLGGDSVEEYAVNLFKENGIGQKGKDNGVLLLVARGERQVRIETGYGIEPVITDALAKRIISDVLAPKTKAEDWNGGIIDGAQAILKILRDPKNAEDVVGKAASTENGSDIAGIIVLVVLLLLFFLIIVIYFSGSGSSRGYGGYSGGYSGGGYSGGSSSWSSGGGGGFSGGGGGSGGGGASGGC